MQGVRRSEHKVESANDQPRAAHISAFYLDCFSHRCFPGVKLEQTLFRVRTAKTTRPNRAG